MGDAILNMVFPMSGKQTMGSCWGGTDGDVDDDEEEEEEEDWVEYFF
jgi:hypothetical protein